MRPPDAHAEQPTLRRSYRYRLYLTRKQEAAAERQLDQNCGLYNAALQQRREAYREYGVSVMHYDQIKELTEARASGQIDNTANCSSQQAVLRRADRSVQEFFGRIKAGKKPGYPRYKSRRRYNTLEFLFSGNAGGIKIMESGRLRIQGIGHIKMKMHRSIPRGAKLCEARVTNRHGHWYVAIMFKDIPPQTLPSTGRSVGIDLGITTFAATSDGELIEGPRAERASAQARRVAHRRISRRQRGSNRRRKAGILLARHLEHERNVRRDHAHKVAADLVHRYDTICIEKLDVVALIQSKLGRDCEDQGWAQFLELLHEKAESAAREVIPVVPRNTSQECSACGATVPKTLKDRIHRCACGYVADRDVNAARNILARGLGRSLQAITVGEEATPSPEKPLPQG